MLLKNTKKTNQKFLPRLIKKRTLIALFLAPISLSILSCASAKTENPPLDIYKPIYFRTISGVGISHWYGVKSDNVLNGWSISNEQAAQSGMICVNAKDYGRIVKERNELRLLIKDIKP